MDEVHSQLHICCTAHCFCLDTAWQPWNKPPQSNYVSGHTRHGQKIERRVVIRSSSLASPRAAPRTPTPIITWTLPPPCPRCSDGRTPMMQTQTRRVTVQTLTQTLDSERCGRLRRQYA